MVKPVYSGQLILDLMQAKQKTVHTETARKAAASIKAKYKVIEPDTHYCHWYKGKWIKASEYKKSNPKEAFKKVTHTVLKVVPKKPSLKMSISKLKQPTKPIKRSSRKITHVSRKPILKSIQKPKKMIYKGFIVTGNTYPVKNLLKSVGGKWNKDYEAWIIPANKLAAKQANELKKTKGLKIRPIKTEENVFRRITEAERLDIRREKADKKIDKWEGAAHKKSVEAQRAFKAADDLVKDIPLGQPILVGHHSEKAHRRTITRAQNYMFKGVEANQAGRKYEDKAEGLSKHMDYIEDPRQLKGRLVKLEKEKKYWENKLKNIPKEIAAKTAAHKMWTNGSKESEEEFKKEIEGVKNQEPYFRRQIANKQADIESIKALIPKSESGGSARGVNMDMLSGAKLKKAVGVKTVSKRYHNKNLAGGNFAIELRNGNGADCELHGTHDPDNIIVSLSIGPLFGGRGYPLITKENYREMTFDKILPIIKKYVEQIKHG